MGTPDKPGPAPLCQAGKDIGRTRQQSPVMDGQDHAVVRNEACEGNDATAGGIEKGVDKRALAGAGGTADQDRTRPDQYGGGVDARHGLPASAGRKADNEARAQHGGLAVMPWRPHAVFGPDAAAMRLDDLLGDG